jgi:hypothetical protein
LFLTDRLAKAARQILHTLITSPLSPPPLLDHDLKLVQDPTVAVVDTFTPYTANEDKIQCTLIRFLKQIQFIRE